jgi:hypothetical protein
MLTADRQEVEGRFRVEVLPNGTELCNSTLFSEESYVRVSSILLLLLGAFFLYPSYRACKKYIESGTREHNGLILLATFFWFSSYSFLLLFFLWQAADWSSTAIVVFHSTYQLSYDAALTLTTVALGSYVKLISCSQATGGPGTRRTRRVERSGARRDGVWAKFPGTSRKFKLGAAKGKPQTQTPQTPPL